MDKKALQELYLSNLRDEGFRGEIDSDGDIRFKYEGMNCFIVVHEDDDKFHKIIFPQFWTLETQDEKIKALIITNALNRQYKNGKLYLVGDLENVTATVELFLNNEGDFKVFFLRMMSILQGMANDFASEMKKTD